MKRGVWGIIALLCTAVSCVWANDSTMWHQGRLVLLNGTELQGELNYNWVAQIVQCQQGPIIKAYSANQIQVFTYLDEQASTFRKFVAIDCPAKSGLRRPRILEEVVSGSVMVYREFRPTYELIKAARPTAYASDDDLLKDVNTFTYLVYFDQELMDMDVFYRKIWPHIKVAFDYKLKEYSNSMRADTMGVPGQLRLIHWYNRLIEKTIPSLLPQPADLSAGN